MSEHDGADVPRSALKLLGKVGDGGQGEVHEVGGPGRLLYKSYREPQKADGASLATLVSLRQALGEADRDRLDRETAWPLCRVVDGRLVTGFLMHRAPASMTWTTSRGESKLTELSYLLREPKAAWQAVGQPSPAERYALTVALVDLFRWLHTLGLVIGDLSQANVLWTVAPAPAAYLLDCDGARPLGCAPVLEQADTPDWQDPLAPPGAVSVDSDRYKAALMIGRVLAQDAYTAPGRTLNPVPGSLDERREAAVLRLWEQAAGPYGTRPDLGQWQAALAGRDTIKLMAARPVPRPVVDRSKFDGGDRNRGTISFRR
ncbi:hypothetical protein CP967_20970 [Streptomyces nitrosporeus]|uniref:Protein kinase domain-containing protein n=1 Tax=Streptomyces nitrosporeus TaxID=28894 RepID=A0A5J6FE96_9ACTN|nr:hypothetical protein [Streptomyces nitrosporeus]QEU74137.1 hypothetical protein CP967_20970 [Streptomyces nitrosporeus]GGZ26325.1 hypothetical protein GCM10010327_66160 [Streptomyces nitrosporeus]